MNEVEPSGSPDPFCAFLIQTGARCSDSAVLDVTDQGLLVVFVELDALYKLQDGLHGRSTPASHAKAERELPVQSERCLRHNTFCKMPGSVVSCSCCSQNSLLQACFRSTCKPATYQVAIPKVQQRVCFTNKGAELKCKGERIRELAVLLKLDHCSVVYLELPKVQTTLQLRVCQQQLPTADKLDFAIHEAGYGVLLCARGLG